MRSDVSRELGSREAYPVCARHACTESHDVELVQRQVLKTLTSCSWQCGFGCDVAADSAASQFALISVQYIPWLNN